jgi:hypothetical protein
MNANSATASGTTNGLTLPSDCSTWRVTAPISISQIIWTLPGTLLVTFDRTQKPRPMTMAPAITVVQIVSA